MIKDLFVYAPIFITFFWAITFLGFPDKTQAHKRILGYFMVAALGIYISHAVYFQNLKSAYWVFDVLYECCSLLVYPLFYLYLRSLTRNENITRKDLRFFLPALGMSSLLLILYLLMDGQQRMDYLSGYLYSGSSDFTQILPQIQSGLYILGRFIYSIQVVAYFIMGISLLNMYELTIFNFYSHLDGKKLTWTSFLNYTFFTSAILSIVFNLLGKSTFIEHSELIFIPAILFSVLLFFIGFQGNIQNTIVPGLWKEVKKDDNRHPLSAEDANPELEIKLRHLFEVEKLYLKTNLKITDVSKKVLTNRTYISHYINTVLGMSFNTYVNQFRVNEATELMRMDWNESIKMEEIAEKSGFGSLKSFQRSFKDHTGQNPLNFRKNLQKDVPLLKKA